jgi:hypothetical protein
MTICNYTIVVPIDNKGLFINKIFTNNPLRLITIDGQCVTPGVIVEATLSATMQTLLPNSISISNLLIFSI